MDTEELVTIYSLKNPTQAEVIRMALEGEGIACFLEGKTQAGLTGIFDIDVQVKAADADRARELIKAHEPVETHETYDDEAEEPGETGETADDEP